jgi:hypothetical protein
MRDLMARSIDGDQGQFVVFPSSAVHHVKCEVEKLWHAVSKTGTRGVVVKIWKRGFHPIGFPQWFVCLLFWCAYPSQFLDHGKI